MVLWPPARSLSVYTLLISPKSCELIIRRKFKGELPNTNFGQNIDMSKGHPVD